MPPLRCGRRRQRRRQRCRPPICRRRGQPPMGSRHRYLLPRSRHRLTWWARRRKPQRQWPPHARSRRRMATPALRQWRVHASAAGSAGLSGRERGPGRGMAWCQSLPRPSRGKMLATRLPQRRRARVGTRRNINRKKDGWDSFSYYYSSRNSAAQLQIGSSRPLGLMGETCERKRGCDIPFPPDARDCPRFFGRQRHGASTRWRTTRSDVYARWAR